MPKFTSPLSPTTNTSDVVVFIQAQLEVPKDTPIGIVMDGGKIRSIEMEGIQQPAFDSLMTRVQLQFPQVF